MRVFANMARRLGITPSERGTLARRMLLFTLLTGIPVLGLVTVEGLKAEMQTQHREQTLTPDRLSQLCDLPGPELRDVCARRAHLNVVEAGAALAILFAFALPTSIRIAAWAAGRRRSVYLSVRDSGPRLAIACTGVLAALQGAIAVATIACLVEPWGRTVATAVTLAAAAAATAAVVVIARATMRILRVSRGDLVSLKLDRQAGSRLYDRVEDLANRVGAPLPHQVVVGLEPEFFTTDIDLEFPDGIHRGRTFYCPLPLLRVLSHAEFDALAGHRLRHPQLPPARADAGTLLHGPLMAPAAAISAYFAETLALAEDKHDHDRELAADRDAARLAGPLEVASAFAKAHAVADLWERIQDAANKLQKGRSPKNVSKAAAELVATKGNFPPIAAADAALSWIEGIETLEEALSARYEVRVEKPPLPQPRAVTRRTAL